MIPVTLQLCNFLSYGRDVPLLDFTRFNIASLSGGNGQGKSALLDALTWALWGEGRKAQQEKKADRGLLKIGESRMWVDLVIELEGERYRIIRKFSLIKKRSHSELELMVFDPQKDDFISLSASSLRETQQRINSILRMDYDTFINSAFILQGRVDEFTRKSARERKQILSEVLGLSHYEQLSVLARKEARVLEKKIIDLKARQEQFQKEISQRDMVLEEIKLIEQDEIGQLKIIDQKRDLLQILEQENQRLSFTGKQLEEIASRISAEQKELQELSERRERIEKNYKEYQSLLVGEKDILSAYLRYQNLSRESQKMLLLMEEYRRLEKGKRGLENHIENSKNRLKLQVEQKQEKYKEFEEKTSSLPAVKEKIKYLKSQLKYFGDLQQKKEQIEEEGNLARIEIESRQAHLNRLKEAIVNSQEKIIMLKKGAQDFCPLCHSPLDEQKKENIELSIEQEIKENELESRKLAGEIAILNEKRSVLQKEWKNIRAELAKKEEVQNSLNGYNLQLKEGEKYFGEIKELAKAIKVLQSQINGEEFDLKERKDLAEIEEKIRNLNYSDKKYVEISRDLEKLKEIPVQREKLLEAKKSIIRLEEEKRGVERQYEDKERSINRLKASQKSLKDNTVKIVQLKEQITAQKKILNQLLKDQHQLVLKKGASQEKLMKIEQFQEQQKKLEHNQKELSYQRDIYEKLSTAFGKNGIPSMIIENAIPELEEEANAILSRLSDEPITVSLESLKELQSGETRETLDIKIHDEMGIRPYELYSGGEAFRIDFAIRIALSKLLTFRAGAPLRTLVIDEGFGTQDEDGLQKLIQAINSIQDDFAKIIVITHLPTLKDAFPVRIEVWKDPVIGSQFEMIHL